MKQDFAHVNPIPCCSPTVFEQYEYRGWLITIENYFGTEELIGFATPMKYAHILTIDNYRFSDIVAEENGIEEKFYEDGDSYYEDYRYIVAEPDDAISILNIEDRTSASCVLDYMTKEIIYELGVDAPKTIVLKQINKKSIKPKSSVKQRGFLQVAWSSLVKARDQKCVECGSVYLLHAHHIKSYKTHPELRHDVSNGITLCAHCHRKWHKENGKK